MQSHDGIARDTIPVHAETLERLAIPSLDQMSISVALSAAAGASSPGGAAPADQADSPPASPEPAGVDELLGGGGASSDQSASEESSVTDSERTLIGAQAAGGAASLPATPSISPAGSDYQSMLSPQEEVQRARALGETADR